MNAKMIAGADVLDLGRLGVDGLGDDDLVRIAGGVTPAAAGLALAIGFVAVAVVGVCVGVAMFYLAER